MWISDLGFRIFIFEDFWLSPSLFLAPSNALSLSLSLICTLEVRAAFLHILRISIAPVSTFAPHFTMPIDYSKWDRIELSDDSDIEVHPNVDKKSFIKWKQRDIHEKRQQRNIEIKASLVQLTMYAKLNERVDYLINNLLTAELLDDQKIKAVLDAGFNPAERFDYEKLKSERGDSLRKGLKDLTFDQAEVNNSPPYNEMIEDLFTQIKEDHPETAKDGENLKAELQAHRAKIDDVLLKQTIKLDDLLYQKSLLISSDDYHTGFDRSFLNKDNDDDGEQAQSHTEKQAALPAEKPKSEPSKVTTVETINSPAQKSEAEIFDELKVLPATEEFSKIEASDLRKSADFLIKHTSICTEHQKDSLIMTAFDSELLGDSARTAQIVHQSLLLQYVAQLAGQKPSKDVAIKAIKLFFSKLSEKGSPAAVAFKQDVDNTVNHIKTRSKIIQQEQQQQAGDEEEEGLIQLKALDESTELHVNTPAEGTPEYEIFTTKLSAEMQNAIKLSSLDAVNEVFAKMKIEEAEEVLEIFNECGVIGVSGVLENEEEFERLKEQYEGVEEPQLSTVDEVD